MEAKPLNDKKENENSMDRLLSLLDKKKRNDEQCSTEDLQGRYKKHYDKLCGDIKQLIVEFVPSLLLGGMKIRVEDTEDAKRMKKYAEMIISDNSQVVKKAIDTALSSYDFDLAIEELEPVRKKMVKVYMEYWLKHCKPVSAPGYTFYNDIVDMYYAEESNLWVSKENGMTVFSILFPPTEELAKAELA